jgi:hypothetical protein
MHPPIGINDSELALDQFQTPNSFFWPSYMWIWNDRLTSSEILAQLADMAKHCALSVMPVPEPKQFRPVRQPTLLEPEYMSEEYLMLYRQMVEDCKRLGMQVWLYDEGGWPSGSVCGELVKKYPELKAQQIQHKKISLKSGQTIKIPSDCICGVVKEGMNTHTMISPGTSTKAMNSNSILWLFSVKKGGSYPDLLNPQATQRFLELTHHRYDKAIGSHFGDTIQLTFTDEPRIERFPWTDRLIDDFQTKYGYDLRQHLPSLFEGDSESDRRVRIDYYDWWTAKFASAYFKQIQAWCNPHQLLSGGHLGGEDETINAIRHGFGHVLRQLRCLDIPGVDAIWRQIWPGKNNHHFPRYAATAAHQGGKRWALSESFAVYGAGLNLAQMKWIVNYQLVRGINLFDFATYQYSNNYWFIGGERPVFGPINPLWLYIALLHSYVARLCYVLSQGQPVISVALYYPVRDLWAGGEDAEKVANSNDEIASLLEMHQIDFDFIDDDVISQAIIQPSSNLKHTALFCIGPMKYTTLIFSRTKWIAESSKHKLTEFTALGGKILCWDKECSDFFFNNIPSLTKANLPIEVPPTILVKNNQTEASIRTLIRRIGDDQLYFLINEGTKPTIVDLTFPENKAPMLLDPESGQWYAYSNVQILGNKCVIHHEFAFGDSLILYFSQKLPDNLIPFPIYFDGSKSPIITLNKPWSIRKTREFLIKRHNIEVSQHQNDIPQNIALGDWTPVIGKDFSGDCEYQINFDCSHDQKSQIHWLDLGKVCYCCEVYLNGHSLGKKAWEPYRFSVNEYLFEGTNQLRVVVTNTLANQYTTTRFWTKWSGRRLGPYHPKALKFEKDSVKSGLFGPVIFF